MDGKGEDCADTKGSRQEASNYRAVMHACR